MKALVFRHNLAREAASAIGGRVDRRAFVSRVAPVRLEDVDELPLPASDWVRVRTTFSGRFGSDVKQILLNGSRANPLTALVSFPHVLGHEVAGRKTDTNERVVLNPWLSCVPRGIDPPCAACLGVFLVALGFWEGVLALAGAVLILRTVFLLQEGAAS